MRGPDAALVEYAGNHPAERFNHVHLYQEDPIGALEWYQKHLNAPLRPGYAPTPAGEARQQSRARARPHLAGLEPRGNVPLAARRGRVRRRVDDVVREPGRPAVGQLARPVAGPHRAKVTDLDAWADKLKSEGVTFLERPYPLGDTRALMIEGPSHEAIELVEVG